MALRTTEQDEKELNPGESDYDRKFNDIAKQEESGTLDDIESRYNDTADDSQENKNIQRAKDRENNPSQPWKYEHNDEKKKKVTGRFSGLKKKGPLAAIGLTVIGGLIGVTGLLSPSILLVHMKEALVKKFNTQTTSMEARSRVLTLAKLAPTPAGVCTGAMTVQCKEATMTDDDVARYKSQGIEVEQAGDKIDGRTKPASFSFNGEKITQANFDTFYDTNTEFRSAVKIAGNTSEEIGFADRIWQKVATADGITKNRPLVDGDDAAKEKSIETEVKNGKKIAITDPINCTGDTCTDSSGKPLSDTESAAARAAKAEAAEVAEQVVGASENSAEKAIANVASATGTSPLSAVKVTGPLDLACQAYTAVRALGYAAKTVRAVQLARYAMVFLTTADEIKDGTAKPEDVAYLGGILTSVAYDAKGAIKRKAAMDSFGMQYTLFGNVGKSDSYVSQFMAGGGLTGDLVAVTSYINTMLGKTPVSTCATLNNTWVQVGSTAAGIILLLIPGVNVAVTAADVIKGVGTAAVSVGLALLPELLKDIVAGTVTKNLKGEDSGNAITSGSGALMSSLAQNGGGGTLSVDDAVAYNGQQNEIQAQIAVEDRAKLSPLDISNSNTFLGSIVSSMLPTLSQSVSTTNTISGISSIITQSLGSIFPTSSALTAAETRAGYTSCTDPDYVAQEIATDPFCNPIYGIPVQYLGTDPVQVATELESSGDIDPTTGAAISGSSYSNYLTNCINRTEPIGSTGAAGTGSDGSECKVTALNAKYYLYTVDQRVSGNMDSDPTIPAASPTDVTAAPTTAQPANTTKKGKGWVLTKGVDYSGTACDSRTTDVGTYKNPSLGFTVRLCHITVTPSSSGANINVDAAVVNSLVSTNVENMFEAAKASGLTIGISSGMRSTSNKYYTSGSMHSQGLAMDLGSPRGGLTVCFISGGEGNGAGAQSVANAAACRARSDNSGNVVRWLDANAAKYGYFNLPGEPWHWSTSGG